MRGFLRLGPCNRLVAREPLHLVHIRLDQARIDRERFASDKPRRNAHRHHTLEYPAQGIARSETFAPRSTEHRMIWNAVFDPEFTKPPVGQVNLDFSAEPPFRTERKYVADDQHTDHQHRINRRPASVRVERRQLVVHPTQVEQAIDLPYEVVRRHNLVEIKRIKELALTALLPSQHAPLPQMPVSTERNHGPRFVSTPVLQHNPS